MAILRLLIHSFLFLFSDIDECENVTCSGRGECIDRINGFVCRCNSSFFGDLCEKGTATLEQFFEELFVVRIETILICF